MVFAASNFICSQERKFSTNRTLFHSTNQIQEVNQNNQSAFSKETQNLL